MTDEQLATRLAQPLPDEPLVAEAYRRFFPAMFQTAATVLGRQLGLAEDVAQETLSRLLLDGTLRHLRERQKIKSFLMVAARNAARDLQRKLRGETLPAQPDDELRRWIDDEALAAERDRALAVVARVLSSLSTEDQAILNARFFREQSIAEIAAELGCSYAAAAQRLSRALSRARKKAGVFSRI